MNGPSPSQGMKRGRSCVGTLWSAVGPQTAGRPDRVHHGLVPSAPQEQDPQASWFGVSGWDLLVPGHLTPPALPLFPGLEALSTELDNGPS